MVTVFFMTVLATTNSSVTRHDASEINAFKITYGAWQFQIGWFDFALQQLIIQVLYLNNKLCQIGPMLTLGWFIPPSLRIPEELGSC